MKYEARNIRSFIGSKDFLESKTFYKELGFQIHEISEKMVLIKVNDELAFYLQDYYVKKWVNNSMLFLEVDDISSCYDDLLERNLHAKYKYVRLSEIKTFEWGRECFLHDPSGNLWHFCEF